MSQRPSIANPIKSQSYMPQRVAVSPSKNSVIRHIRKEQEKRSAGELPGIYLKPERRSKVQFDPIFLSSNCYSKANFALNRELNRLFSKHGESNIDWYAERSLGLDVAGKIAWNNMDITEAIVS
jgi:hypothetical protein